MLSSRAEPKTLLNQFSMLLIISAGNPKLDKSIRHVGGNRAVGSSTGDANTYKVNLLSIFL